MFGFKRRAAVACRGSLVCGAPDAFVGDAQPLIHLLDGGVSDNAGMRSVLDSLQALQALHEAGVKTTLCSARRIVVFIVSSLSLPPTQWDQSETPPGTVEVLLQAAGSPIDAYAYETTELLKDSVAQWQAMRLIRDSVAMQSNMGPAVTVPVRVPNAEIHSIDVSFPALKDKAELAFLNQQPTIFVLPDEAVDRLRSAGGTTIADAPEFTQLLRDLGATMVVPPTAAKP